MRRVFRMVSALGAGAALVWGLAKSLRRRKDEADGADDARDGGSQDWPPKPEPKPEPEAKSEPEEKSAPDPEPEPEAEPEADEPEADEPSEEAEPAEPEADEPSDPPAEEVVIKGVVIEDPAAFLKFANSATEEELEAAGIKGKPQSVLIDARPFDTVESVGATKGVGRRTLQSLNGAL